MGLRALAMTVVLAAGAQFGYADDVVGGDPTQDTINAKDLQKYFSPYVPAVRDCYAANANGHGVTGALRLELVIHPEGHVHRFAFEAPGVKGAWLRKLDQCLRPLSKTWKFPYRRGFTSAVLPFKFTPTVPPGGR